MKEVINTEIRQIVNKGEYFGSKYFETVEITKRRMNGTQYRYYITTADNILHFYTKDKSFELLKNDFDWRILWDKLGDIPVNENDEIDEPFEHFEVGTDKVDIWKWFEWFFDITLGDEIYK